MFESLTGVLLDEVKSDEEGSQDIYWKMGIRDYKRVYRSLSSASSKIACDQQIGAAERLGSCLCTQVASGAEHC